MLAFLGSILLGLFVTAVLVIVYQVIVVNLAKTRFMQILLTLVLDGGIVAILFFTIGQAALIVPIIIGGCAILSIKS